MIVKLILYPVGNNCNGDKFNLFCPSVPGKDTHKLPGDCNGRLRAPWGESFSFLTQKHRVGISLPVAWDVNPGGIESLFARFD